MFSYQSLDVYQIANEFHSAIYKFVCRKDHIPKYIKNQLGRAALSIVLNIAEGSAKFGPRDRRNFFVIARGSVFECSALISILQSEKEIDKTKEVGYLRTLDSLSKMLYSMIKNLEK